MKLLSFNSTNKIKQHQRRPSLSTLCFLFLLLILVLVVTVHCQMQCGASVVNIRIKILLKQNTNLWQNSDCNIFCLAAIFLEKFRLNWNFWNNSSQTKNLAIEIFDMKGKTLKYKNKYFRFKLNFFFNIS